MKSKPLKFPMSIKYFNELVEKYSIKESQVFKHGSPGYNPEVLADYVEMDTNSIQYLLDKGLVTGFVKSEMAFTPSGREEVYVLGAEFSTFYGDQGGTVFTVDKSNYDNFVETYPSELNEPQLIGNTTEPSCIIL